MSATKDRQTPVRERGRSIALKMAAIEIFAGTMVGVNAAGFALMADDATVVKVMGVAEQHLDNSGGAAGDLTIRVSTGTYKFANGSGAIVQADIGKKALVVDNETVTDAAGAVTNDVEAGLIEEIESDGVWITIDPRG